MKEELPIYDLPDITFQISQMTLAKDFFSHTHDCFEMELILSGKGRHLLNGREYPLFERCIYLLTPSDVHSITVEEPLRYYHLQFTEELLWKSGMSESLLQMQGCQLLLTNEEQEQIYLLLMQLEKEAQRAQPLSSLYIQSLMQCILIILFRKQQSFAKEETENTHISDALLYVHRHFREPISLEEVAKATGFSPHYFCQRFYQVTGKHFVDYLTQLRSRYAKNLLQQSQMSVTDICYFSGFGSYASFSRAMRRRYGKTPLQLR